MLYQISELDLKEDKKDGKDNASSPVDPEAKLEEYRQCIRKAETGKCKAEARIEALRAGNGIEFFFSLTAEKCVDFVLLQKKKERKRVMYCIVFWSA